MRSTDKQRQAQPRKPGQVMARDRLEIPTREEVLEGPVQMSRRAMLRVMGAMSMVALGVPGCDRKPKRKIISRVDGPEYQTPGKTLLYSSTWTEGPYPYGLVVKTVDGRPVKVDGNPSDPVTRGSSSAAMQAALPGLYDPDRLKGPQAQGTPIGWEEVDRRVVEALSASTSTVIVTPPQVGPSERALLTSFLAAAPHAVHFVHDITADLPRRSAWRKVYGSDGEVVPRFDRARVILSLDSDFLGTDGPTVANIRRFAEGRRLKDGAHATAAPSRLYVVEGGISLTGSNGEHRIRLKPSKMGVLLTALTSGDGEALGRFARAHRIDPLVLAALRRDLYGNVGEALVVAGPHLPEWVHAKVAELNHSLEAGRKLLQWDPAPSTLPVSDPEDLQKALAAADVTILLGVNPVADGLVCGGKMVVAHTAYPDETARQAQLALSSSHNLESWNDRIWGQTGESLCQPVIAPLHDSRQEAESLLRWTQALSDETDPIRRHPDWHSYLRDRWSRRAAPGSEAAGGARGADKAGSLLGRERVRAWQESLRQGGRFVPMVVPLPGLDEAAAVRMAPGSPTEGVELVIQPHHALHDGRFANCAWLQELPDPVTKIVWDGVAAMSPSTARKLGVREGEGVSLSVGEVTVELPALIQLGMAEEVVGLTLGHGRTHGEVAREAAGANVAAILREVDRETPRLVAGARVARTSRTWPLVRTQMTFDMHGRPIVLDGSLKQYRNDPSSVAAADHDPRKERLYPTYDSSGAPKWGMAIDLNACVGCSVCVTACQSENNIPVVGREECGKGREMHWLRIDRYEEPTSEEGDVMVRHQPMLCQHCDDAPCEAVCPVKATVHSPEGLNEMIYNRCVGTRYCSNNCPYKVRRFNYLRYQEEQLRDPVQELAQNPQVTVRGVGVMEKCTFCVQRIQEVKIRVKNADGAVRDGELLTACQQACPAEAISFGNVNDPESEVRSRKASPRAFHVLEDLNVNPNITYLARVRNLAVDRDEGGD